MGLDPPPRSFTSLPFTRDLIDAATVIVTLQRGIACNVVQGHRYVDWALAEVEAGASSDLPALSGEIHRRVDQLLAGI
jgi:hypothetical protein